MNYEAYRDMFRSETLFLTEILMFGQSNLLLTETILEQPKIIPANYFRPVLDLDLSMSSSQRSESLTKPCSRPAGSLKLFQ